MRHLYYIRTLGGIPVRLHYTWLILALLGVVVLPGVIFPAYMPELGRLAGLLLALVTLALYVGVVAIHVLVQIVVARRFNVRFPVVNVYPLGLLARLPDRRGSPVAAFWIAAAGPATSLTLWWAIDRIASTGVVPYMWMAVALYVTAQLSFYLGLFSVLPGLPLDGGRMLRALHWQITGSFESATRFARAAGQVIAYGLIFAGVSSFAADGNWVRAGALVLVGWAIREAGGTAYRRTLVTGLLNRLTAGDILRAPERVVAPELSLRAFALTLRGRTGTAPTPVVLKGMFVGMINRNLLCEVLQGEWDTRTVADVMAPAEDLILLTPETPLSEFVPHFVHDAEQSVVLPVVRDGRLVGLINADELIDVIDLEDEFGLFAPQVSAAQPGAQSRAGSWPPRATLLPEPERASERA